MNIGIKLPDVKSNVWSSIEKQVRFTSKVLIPVEKYWKLNGDKDGVSNL